MKSSPQVYFVVTGMLCLISLFAIFLPLQKQQEELDQQASKEEAKLSDFKATLKNLPAYLDKSADLNSTKRNLANKLYTRSEVLSLLRQLYLDAEKHKLSINEVTPPVQELLQLNRIVTDSLQPLFLNIYLKMDGGYTDFGKFVQTVESSDYFRGTNICQIIGSKEETRTLDFHFGFRVLLGLVGAQ